MRYGKGLCDMAKVKYVQGLIYVHNISITWAIHKCLRVRI